MTQNEFDFDYPEPPPEGSVGFPSVCKTCGKNFFYHEFPDRERNLASPSWLNYCSRACFVKGFKKTWQGDSNIFSLMAIEGISAEELAEA